MGNSIVVKASELEKILAVAREAGDQMVKIVSLPTSIGCKITVYPRVHGGLKNLWQKDGIDVSDYESW
jgi:hypothetical protein